MFADKVDPRPRKVSGSQWSQWSKNVTTVRTDRTIAMFADKVDTRPRKVLMVSMVSVVKKNDKSLSSSKFLLTLYDCQCINM